MISCKFEDSVQAFLRHVTVDAILLNESNQILLVKRAPSLVLEPNKWALLGGFLDRDKTAKKAVMREVIEETGHESEVVTLFRINDNPDRRGEDRKMLL